jgi:hypothetical protein
LLTEDASVTCDVGGQEESFDQGGTADVVFEQIECAISDRVSDITHRSANVSR